MICSLARIKYISFLPMTFLLYTLLLYLPTISLSPALRNFEKHVITARSQEPELNSENCMWTTG
jgi:hypothetical protein